MDIDHDLSLEGMGERMENFWDHSGQKILAIKENYDERQGTPVFTAAGKYTTRGWTEWTQGFQYGSAILQFDATGDEQFLDYGRRGTVERMASHVSHFGVHDHGFNNVSTYGNLLRLMRQGILPAGDWEKHFYEMALKLSGAVQARRWTPIQEGGGFLYSFNGPHSLFVDTIRTVRALVVGHELGHSLLGDNDVEVSLLDRAVHHGLATAQYAVYYGEGRDSYDVWGRTAHESIFNTNDGRYRCPNAQQGFSGFTTWTRGLAWAMLGFSEELEYLASVDDNRLEAFGGFAEVEAIYLQAARATCDFYIQHTAQDGIPYWDTGAPELHRLGDYTQRRADPYNAYEPVDSSAAAIGCQGLLRLGRYLRERDPAAGERYFQAGLTVLNTLLDEPYLSTDPNHQGLLLHSIYHRPNGWDYVPQGASIPYGESSMWGDYHLREAVLYAGKLRAGEDYHFYDCVS
ncbi:glycosyl hydrolase [Neolewinella litorea]|uniref:Glycosyl hydrolase n=1 Tax=Neolewinella litorea TaxID=2562452 RepID=A0A4V3XLP7_9BACT|nr:glycosyl hydrolase [Neolewinella litorea]THH41713.1 glycosyl hydrolase [Neolewinella litorea]